MLGRTHCPVRVTAHLGALQAPYWLIGSAHPLPLQLGLREVLQVGSLAETSDYRLLIVPSIHPKRIIKLHLFIYYSSVAAGQFVWVAPAERL